MTPRTEPPAVDVSVRPLQRECRTIINRPKGTIGSNRWRQLVIAAVDSIALVDDRIADYWIAPHGDALRLVVHSESPHCATEIAREIKRRALAGCRS